MKLGLELPEPELLLAVGGVAVAVEPPPVIGAEVVGAGGMVLPPRPAVPVEVGALRPVVVAEVAVAAGGSVALRSISSMEAVGAPLRS